MGFTDAPAAAKRTEATNFAFAKRREIFKGQRIEAQKMEGKDSLKRAMYKMGQGDDSELKALVASGEVSEEEYKNALKS